MSERYDEVVGSTVVDRDAIRAARDRHRPRRPVEPYRKPTPEVVAQHMHTARSALAAAEVPSP